MKTFYLQGKTITYTGEQLRSRFAFTEFDIVGDSIVAFRGPCNIKPEAMVDLEDLKNNEIIFSEDMLHFIIEHDETDLTKAVLRQVIFAAIVNDLLNEQIDQQNVIRKGSDLFDGDAKITISIATVTPISSLVHFGINISSENTPVKTKGLRDYNINPDLFAGEVMDRYVQEDEGINKACSKVKWVR